MSTKPSILLIELCDRIRKDPSNAGYLFLLRKYSRNQILQALNQLDNVQQVENARYLAGGTLPDYTID